MNFLRNLYWVGRSRWGRACIRNAVGAPRASATALTTAWVEPIVPASPAPFNPIGLVVDGTLRVSKAIGGKLSARGRERGNARRSWPRRWGRDGFGQIGNPPETASRHQLLPHHPFEAKNVIGAEGHARRLKARLELSRGDAHGGVEAGPGGQRIALRVVRRVRTASPLAFLTTPTRAARALHRASSLGPSG